MSHVALFDSIGASTLTVTSLFNVQGKTAIVTGGGTGLGLTTATTLAVNGARVYITGRRLEVLENASHGFKTKFGSIEGVGSIIPVQADVSDTEGIRSLRATISSKERWIDILINNHGVSEPHGDIESCDQTAEGLSGAMFEGDKMETWLSTYKINTASYFFTTFAFLPLLAAAQSLGGRPEPGNVINISSMSGITKTSQHGQFNYNAGKAATINLSHQLATEFARRNLKIRVNVICPGYFPSGMTVIPQEDNTGSDAHQKEFRHKWAIPFGRPGNATDYAQTILGVTNNQYMTGCEIVIDGGWLLESAF